MQVFRYILFLFVCLWLTACEQKSTEVELDRLVKVRAFSYTSQQRLIEYPGRVEARYQTELAFQVEGKLIKRLVEVGDYVKVGAAIAMLDPKDYLLNSERVGRQKQAAESDHQRAKRDLVRAKELRQKSFIGQSDLDRAVNIEAAAKATLLALKAQHAKSLNQRGYTELLAPATGIITHFTAEVGSVLKPGDMVAAFAWDKHWEFVTALAENNINLLHKGSKGVIDFWAFPDQKIEASVRELSPVSSKGSPSYSVKLALTERPALLKLGMTGHVVFTRVDEKVGLMPASALLFDGEVTSVLVVDPKTLQTHLQQVTFGEPVDEEVSILSGLKEGQLVVVAGANKVTVGQKVRLFKP